MVSGGVSFGDRRGEMFGGKGGKGLGEHLCQWAPHDVELTPHGRSSPSLSRWGEVLMCDWKAWGQGERGRKRCVIL